MFYDFGMMCETAKSKDDLLDVFYGIYEKDSAKVRVCRCWTSYYPLGQFLQTLASS